MKRRNTPSAKRNAGHHDRPRTVEGRKVTPAQAREELRRRELAGEAEARRLLFRRRDVADYFRADPDE